METFCYELAEGGHLDALPMEDALKRWRAGDGAFWIDAHGYDGAELEGMLDKIGVSAFLRQRCLEAGHATAVVAVPKEELSTSSVLCAVLLRRGAETARATRALRDHVLELSQRMDQDPSSVETPELEQLKRSVILTNAIAEEQEEAFDLISQAQSSGLDLARMRSSSTAGSAC